MGQNMKTLTKRQEKILNALIGEYIKKAEPVSSKLLCKEKDFDVCPATIRNEMQRLTDMGYVSQPHTSAGRVPTEKAYYYFIDIVFGDKKRPFSHFVFKEIKETKRQIEKELELAENLMESLEEMASTFNVGPLAERDNLFEALAKIGPSRIAFGKNISLISSLIEELENLENQKYEKRRE